MSTGTLVVTCGLPGSGKTTFVRRLVEQFQPIVVCDDALVDAVHGGDYTQYNPLFKDLYHGLEDMILDSALSRGHHLIVVDRCCPKADTRSRYANKAKAYGYRTVLAFFDLEKPSDGDKVKRRMLGGSRGHTAQKWMEVIQKMKKGFELPSRMESFDIIAPPEIAMTFIKLAVTEDLSKGPPKEPYVTDVATVVVPKELILTGSVAGSSSPVDAQSSPGSLRPSDPSPTEPRTEAATMPTLSLPQTETSPPPVWTPQAEPGPRPSSPGRKSPVKPVLRKSTGSSSGQQG